MKQFFRNNILFILLVSVSGLANAQLSPGKLTRAHAHLEGLKNCTKCHILGEKETTSKCLQCHSEIHQLINENKGYHSSSDVKGKRCAECHGEHFGLDFKMKKLDENSFNHLLTGFELKGIHAQLKCVDCHNKNLIQNPISQKEEEGTFLGMGTKCLSCHADYHQNTLSDNCLSCHNQEVFRPAKGFNHDKTHFKLLGAHKKVQCVDCHKVEIVNNSKFQQFAGLEFQNCTNCHKDIHNNKFGTDCMKCHTLNSFREVKGLSTFNHDRTDFPLIGYHRFVDCKLCHKGSYTNPVKHNRCSDCHHDYHNNQFSANGISPDCTECHTQESFSPSKFTIKEHSKTKFPLEGAHVATPCFECHKSEDRWEFNKKGNQCISCHENIHENIINKQFMPNNNCKNCHSNSAWNEINFSHNKTNFELSGKHANLNCRDCHFKEGSGDQIVQQFKWATQSCENCHVDIHFKQFELNGVNDCERCHTSLNWTAEKFNHDTARFKLDGKHAGLNCVNCHKLTDGLIRNYVIYKFKDISCASCH